MRLLRKRAAATRPSQTTTGRSFSSGQPMSRVSQLQVLAEGLVGGVDGISTALCLMPVM